MKNLALKVQRFLASEDGPTAVEYAVMLALIVIVCLTVRLSPPHSSDTASSAASVTSLTSPITVKEDLRRTTQDV